MVRQALREKYQSQLQLSMQQVQQHTQNALQLQGALAALDELDAIEKNEAPAEVKP